MMLSLMPRGEPDGQQQTKTKTRQDATQIVSGNKTSRHEQRPGPIEAGRCDSCRHFKSEIIEIIYLFIIQTVGGAEDAT
jgi:hypothetical protein